MLALFGLSLATNLALALLTLAVVDSVALLASKLNRRQPRPTPNSNRTPVTLR
jgi:hypothetical protein